jgi:protein-S-isoprenylcysteine O-methyltransferase Ste14
MLRSFITTLVLYFLLPILGWWLGSSFSPNWLAEYLASPARAVYLACAIATAAVNVTLIPLPARKPSFAERPGSVYWRHISLETVMVLGPFCDRRGLLTLDESELLRWGGLILFILGIAFQVWVGRVRAQAAAASQTPPGQPVLTVAGPFYRLRYPGYAGLLVSTLGAALVFRSFISLAMVLFMLNFIIMRIGEEEINARLKFGIQWTAYAQHSWRLIPWIY